MHGHDCPFTGVVFQFVQEPSVLVDLQLIACEHIGIENDELDITVNKAVKISDFSGFLRGDVVVKMLEVFLREDLSEYFFYKFMLVFLFTGEIHCLYICFFKRKVERFYL